MDYFYAIVIDLADVFLVFPNSTASRWALDPTRLLTNFHSSSIFPILWASGESAPRNHSWLWKPPGPLPGNISINDAVEESAVIALLIECWIIPSTLRRWRISKSIIFLVLLSREALIRHLLRFSLPSLVWPETLSIKPLPKKNWLQFVELKGKCFLSSPLPATVLNILKHTECQYGMISSLFRTSTASWRKVFAGVHCTINVLSIFFSPKNWPLS